VAGEESSGSRAGFSDKKDVTEIMKIITFVVVALVLSLTLATTAFGQSSKTGYSNQAGQVQSDVEGDTAQPVATNTSGGGGGSLPFTGLDVALLVGAGGVLVLAGLGMRRLTRSPGSA
jgi:FlaG/FlaF family flagellin (archaellin)